MSYGYDTTNTQPGTSNPGAGGKATGPTEQVGIGSGGLPPGDANMGGAGKAPMDTGAGDNPTQMPPPGFGAPGGGGKGPISQIPVDMNGNVLGTDQPPAGGVPGQGTPGGGGKLFDMIGDAVNQVPPLTPEQMPNFGGPLQAGPGPVAGLGRMGGTPQDQFGMAAARPISNARNLGPIPQPAPSRVPGRPTQQAIRQQAQAVGLPGATRPAAPVRPVGTPTRAPVARGPVNRGRGAGRGGLLR